ncbi:MAG TPA: hypothetical protein VGJ84_14055 [Polyangiaceae bacterium]|jgi:hypothetical protein
MGASLEFLLGGTPVDGLVIGAGVLTNALASSTVEENGVEISNKGEFSLGSLVGFVNYYFNPEQGFHAQALLGLASGTLTIDPVDPPPPFGCGNPIDGPKKTCGDASGFLVGAGVGWEGWVGKQWSIGGHLRFVYAGMAHNYTYDNVIDNTKVDIAEKYQFFSIIPAFIVTYH